MWVCFLFDYNQTNGCNRCLLLAHSHNNSTLSNGHFIAEIQSGEKMTVNKM